MKRKSVRKETKQGKCVGKNFRPTEAPRGNAPCETDIEFRQADTEVASQTVERCVLVLIEVATATLQNLGKNGLTAAKVKTQRAQIDFSTS